jgi:hypothetical protein
MALPTVLSLALAATTASALTYNTFDGEGFPACNSVKAIHNGTTISKVQTLVRDAAASGTKVRASGKGHMWYDTRCSDDPNTIIIRTEALSAITDFNLAEGAEEGEVTIEAGVTFFQLADYLHQRGATVGNTLVNWNITLAGAVAMGAHRSSLREHAHVVGGVLSMDIVDGKGDIRTVQRDESDEKWLAASTSLGLLGVIVRMRFRIYPDYKVYAMQKTLEEDAVLNGDIESLIAPYATANLWWWPHMRKFHQRYYDQVSTDNSSQEAFQNTFSVTDLEATAARTLLDSGKILPTSNLIAESLFFAIWENPNFRNKATNAAVDKWPVYGWNYDVLIGGLYSGQKPEWEAGLHGYTMEIAFPMTMANAMLKRVRELWDEEGRQGRWMASTYRSGINIKFGRSHFDILGQTTKDSRGKVDWSRGAIMFDFPTFWPTWGDHERFNEPFCGFSPYRPVFFCLGFEKAGDETLLTWRHLDHNLAKTLIDEFPCRPHWTKNTREIFQQSVKNLDPDVSLVLLVHAHAPSRFPIRCFLLVSFSCHFLVSFFILTPFTAGLSTLMVMTVHKTLQGRP